MVGGLSEERQRRKKSGEKRTATEYPYSEAISTDEPQLYDMETGGRTRTRTPDGMYQTSPAYENVSNANLTHPVMFVL